MLCVCVALWLHPASPWWLSCLHCLHCRLTARRSGVRFPHGALLALGGRSSPECTVLKWAISRAFLCGVCMFSPCSQGENMHTPHRPAREIAHLSTEGAPSPNSAPCGNRTQDLLAVKHICVCVCSCCVLQWIMRSV